MTANPVAQQASVAQRTEPRPHLTEREAAVLLQLVEGCTAVAIAHRLGISVRTVQKHLEHLYRKLGVGDRLQAVLVAQRTGLLSMSGVQSVDAVYRGE
jgi:DNA-binding NarL/FixJ family response regulator